MSQPRPDRLVCPRDHTELDAGVELRCAQGHGYPTVGDVPVMLVEEHDPTGFAAESLQRLREGTYDAAAKMKTNPGEVDPVVTDSIVRTNGVMYRHLQAGLPRYPIPELRLPPAHGHRLLDLGAGWGRWSVAASRLGYRPTAVEPQIELCLAARRAAAALGADVRVVAGGGTVLPFLDDAFDVAFSYSVLQHFDKQVARAAMREMVRVTRPGGLLLIQLANRWGAKQLVNQGLVASRARKVGTFRVRYWRPAELRAAVEELTDEHRLEVDGFFSLDPQASDLDLLPSRYRAVVRTSELLRGASVTVPALIGVADSIYVRARVPGGRPEAGGQAATS